MTSNNVLARLRPELGKLQTYAVPDATGLVKLDAMENPYSWPEEVRTQWLDRVSNVNVNRYPEPDPTILKQKLKDQFDPRGDSEVLLGNGSDELIQLLTIAIAKPDASVLTVSPSFSMYQMIAEIVGVKCYVVPLDTNFEIDVNAMLVAIEKYDPALLFIGYPNNPTGNQWSKEDIKEIVDASTGFVVIDEAYGPFAQETFASELGANSNILLLRTASKLGLAGIRFGWLAGEPEVISELNKLRLPYNINQLTQSTMDFALDHYALFSQQAQKICESRKILYNELLAIEGVYPFPSEANFILFKVLTVDVDQVFQRLLAQNVLIKNLNNQPRLSQCLRVTVGTNKENKIFCNALQNALVS